MRAFPFPFPRSPRDRGKRNRGISAQAPLEEVVPQDDLGTRNCSILDGIKRENEGRILVGGVIVEDCAG